MVGAAAKCACAGEMRGEMRPGVCARACVPTITRTGANTVPKSVVDCAES